MSHHRQTACRELLGSIAHQQKDEKYMPDIFTILTALAGVVGPLIAIYQRHERKKLENYNRSQAWYLYSKTNNMTGITQRALDRYKTLQAENINIEVLELLSKSSAFGTDLFREAARAIQFAESEFTEDSVERWIKMGKIDGDDHRSLFVPLLVEKEEKTNLINRAMMLFRLRHLRNGGGSDKYARIFSMSSSDGV
jgi:hypothetical protein